MKRDIPYYIRQILREEKQVSLPGFGVIYLDQEKAYFNADKSLLYPPKLKVRFEDDPLEHEALTTYISEVEGMKPEKVQKKLEKYSNALLNKIINFNAADIIGVGTFVKTDEGKVVLESHAEIITDELAGLSPVKTIPIGRIIQNQSDAFVTNALESDTNKESNTWWIPIAFGVLVALIYILVINKCEGASWQSSNQTNDQQEEVGMSDQAKGENQIANDSIKKETIDLSSAYLEVDEVLNDENAEKLSEKILREKREIDMGAGVDEPNGDQSAYIVNKYGDSIPESGECIVITGSFKKAKHVVMMVSILERKGYNVYQEPYGDFTRVGFKYNCMDTRIDDYLQDVRDTFDGKSWYLNPVHSVPYRD